MASSESLLQYRAKGRYQSSPSDLYWQQQMLFEMLFCSVGCDVCHHDCVTRHNDSSSRRTGERGAGYTVRVSLHRLMAVLATSPSHVVVTRCFHVDWKIVASPWLPELSAGSRTWLVGLVGMQLLLMLLPVRMYVVASHSSQEIVHESGSSGPACI